MGPAVGVGIKYRQGDPRLGRRRIPHLSRKTGSEIVARFCGSSGEQPERYVAGFGFPALEDFGERVRAARRQRGLSQEELGARAGLHRTYIGHIERGEVNPSLRNVLLVAKALEVDPGDLLRGLHL